jgi:hypothetical protein
MPQLCPDHSSLGIHAARVDSQNTFPGVDVRQMVARTYFREDPSRRLPSGVRHGSLADDVGTLEDDVLC